MSKYIATLDDKSDQDAATFLRIPRNIDLARKWLEWRALEKEKYGYLKVWKKSGAKWMLTDRSEDLELLADPKKSGGEIVWQEAGRVLLKAR